MTEEGCWVLKEMCVLVVVLIGLFVVAVVVVAFVLPPVVAWPTGGCGNESYYVYY